MKKIVTLALASLLFISKSSALSLDDIQFWIGSGTNRAALVIEWTTPESMANSTVPAPIADKSLVWGYRFNGSASGTDMLKAILAADPRFYVVADLTYGTFVEGIGYSLDGTAALGVADGTATNYFTNNFLTSFTVDIDAAASLNTNDLYWGGLYGPNWEMWTENGDAGGFTNCPDRGTNPYWTPADPDYYTGSHGQWDLSGYGTDGLQLTNGSWLGFSVAAGEYESSTNEPVPPYDTHKHAPKLPDPSITAVVKNFNGAVQGGQWQAQFLTCSNWVYSLERSTNLQDWTAVVSSVPGYGTNLVLSDPDALLDKAFYRIAAKHP